MLIYDDIIFVQLCTILPICMVTWCYIDIALCESNVCVANTAVNIFRILILSNHRIALVTTFRQQTKEVSAIQLLLWLVYIKSLYISFRLALRVEYMGTYLRRQRKPRHKLPWRQKTPSTWSSVFASIGEQTSKVTLSLSRSYGQGLNDSQIKRYL